LTQLLGAPTAGTGLERVAWVSPTPARRAFNQVSVFCHRPPSARPPRNSCARVGRVEVSEIAGFHPVEDANALTDSKRLQGKPAASPPTLFRRDSFLGPTG